MQNLSQSYGASPAVWSYQIKQCYLSPDIGKRAQL